MVAPRINLKARPIDIRRVKQGAEPFHRTIVADLESTGVYSKGLLYRVVESNRLLELLRTGRDQPTPTLTFLTEDELTAGRGTAVTHVAERGAALAVFDQNHLRRVNDGREYTFKSPGDRLKALLAVYKPSRPKNY